MINLVLKIMSLCQKEFTIYQLIHLEDILNKNSNIFNKNSFENKTFFCKVLSFIFYDLAYYYGLRENAN